MCTITVATVFALPLSATLDTNQNGWNTAGSARGMSLRKVSYEAFVFSVFSRIREKRSH